MIEFIMRVNDDILMVFITQRLQQYLLHVFFAGLLEEFIAEGKFNLFSK